LSYGVENLYQYKNQISALQENRFLCAHLPLYSVSLLIILVHDFSCVVVFSFYSCTFVQIVKATMDQYLWFIPLGFVIGAYGTLIGAGGGFVLMPILILLYPGEKPELLTSISLAVVFCNAASGSWAYARMKRIDYKSAWLFAAVTIPGAVIGALTTGYIPRRVFDTVFGFLLIAASIFLFMRLEKEKKQGRNNSPSQLTRNLVEADGTSHAFSYNPKVGIGLSFLVGYLASLLGIGGGIIHVPALVHLLNFPVHIATATSHFILALTALTATLVHITTGVFSHGMLQTIFLAVGVILGAQVGARWSSRIEGSWIIRGLAVALAMVGIRILVLAL
jgi:uncharacterized membrane protein YfcA